MNNDGGGSIHTNKDDPDRLGKLMDDLRTCVGAFTLIQMVAGGLPPDTIAKKFVADLERITKAMREALDDALANPPAYTYTDDASAREVAKKIHDDLRKSEVRSTVKHTTIFGEAGCSSRQHMFSPLDAPFCVCGSIPNPR